MLAGIKQADPTCPIAIPGNGMWIERASARERKPWSGWGADCMGRDSREGYSLLQQWACDISCSEQRNQTDSNPHPGCLGIPASDPTKCPTERLSTYAQFCAYCIPEETDFIKSTADFEYPINHSAGISMLFRAWNVLDRQGNHRLTQIRYIPCLEQHWRVASRLSCDTALCHFRNAPAR